MEPTWIPTASPSLWRALSKWHANFLESVSGGRTYTSFICPGCMASSWREPYPGKLLQAVAIHFFRLLFIPFMQITAKCTLGLCSTVLEYSHQRVFYPTRIGSTQAATAVEWSLLTGVFDRYPKYGLMVTTKPSSGGLFLEISRPWISPS